MGKEPHGIVVGNQFWDEEGAIKLHYFSWTWIVVNYVIEMISVCLVTWKQSSTWRSCDTRSMYTSGWQLELRRALINMQ